MKIYAGRRMPDDWKPDQPANLPQAVVRAPQLVAPLPEEQWPGYIQEIAQQRIPGEVGVGDTVERVIGSMAASGVPASEAFKQWFDRKTGYSSVPCRCTKDRWNVAYKY